jgi:hypothetical protein
MGGWLGYNNGKNRLVGLGKGWMHYPCLTLPKKLHNMKRNLEF